MTPYLTFLLDLQILQYAIRNCDSVQMTWSTSGSTDKNIHAQRVMLMNVEETTSGNYRLVESSYAKKKGYLEHIDTFYFLMNFVECGFVMILTKPNDKILIFDFLKIDLTI